LQPIHYIWFELGWRIQLLCYLPKGFQRRRLPHTKSCLLISIDISRDKTETIRQTARLGRFKHLVEETLCLCLFSFFPLMMHKYGRHIYQVLIVLTHLRFQPLYNGCITVIFCSIADTLLLTLLAQHTSVPASFCFVLLLKQNRAVIRYVYVCTAAPEANSDTF
jgi:hypothetical protein